jgi:multidrug efflux system membrane fusion protein
MRPRAKVKIGRTFIGVGAVALAAVGLALTLSYCAHSPAPGTPATPGGVHGKSGRGSRGGSGAPMITVAVATASLGPIPVQLSGLGTVTPLATISVNARVSGMLDKVAFKEGQMVKKGQLLAVIDPRPFEVAEQQAQAQLLHDQSLLATARTDLKRYQTLAAQDSISGQTVDTQVQLVRQDEATVVADQAALANAKLNLSFTHITSPVSGRVGLRQIDAGNQITANETTPITVVTQMTPMTVVFTLPESAIGQVSQRGGGGLPVQAYDRAGGSVLARGALATLDNEIDTTTGTVKAKANFPNTDGALFPSQFVNVVLLVDTLQNQVIVPTTATRHGPQGDFVWVLQLDKTVKARPVTVGPGTPETVSIVSGLRPGEVVITDGGDKLREGAKVILPRPAPGSAASPGQAPPGGHHHHGSGGQGGPAPAAG